MADFRATLKSDRSNPAALEEAVSALQDAHRLPEEVVFDIRVVLDELISNIIKYGYSDNLVHDIHVTLSADEAAVRISIKDDGGAFDPFAVPDPDLTLPLEQRPVGGLGLHFVRKLMDTVEYKRDKNYNYLFLKKNFSR